MYCSKCKRELNESEKFCSQCGGKAVEKLITVSPKKAYRISFVSTAITLLVRLFTQERYSQFYNYGINRREFYAMPDYLKVPLAVLPVVAAIISVRMIYKNTDLSEQDRKKAFVTIGISFLLAMAFIFVNLIAF